MLEKASVSLLLDSYDAVFSDFDPRPYTERAISDDFLQQAKKAVRETKPGCLELCFLIPKHLKNSQEEVIIKERLHHHFKKYESLIKGESRKIVRNGIILSLTGMILMFSVSMVSLYSVQGVLRELLRVLMEPAGWFIVWYGLDEIFYLSRLQKPDIDFYSKMTHAELQFDVY